MKKDIKFHPIIILSLLVGVLLLKTAIAAPSWQWIDGQRVHSQIKEGSGLWLIDVRNPAAFEATHIEGSVNIPADALAHKQFPAQKTLILVDDSLGQKAAREAAEGLLKKGHERVSVVEGGIVAWKLAGLPMVERNLPVRGVTAAELNWAIAESIPMKIYDLREKMKEPQTRSISRNRRVQDPAPSFDRDGIKVLQKSEKVAGKTLAERVEKLKKTLWVDGKKKRRANKKDLATELKKPEPVILVFAAADDAEGHTKKILQGAKADVRYLIGGYETLISEKLRTKQTAGSCPTCPGSAK